MIDWSAKSLKTTTASCQHDVVQINTESKAILLEKITDCLRFSKGFTVATLNLDHVVKLRKSRSFLHAYASQTFVVADGNPIVWLSRIAGRKIELTPGSELIEPLVALASELDIPVALLGSTEGALEKTAKQLKLLYPEVKIVAEIAPPFGFDPEGEQANICIEQLANAKSRLCFLALGAPKQEIFSVYAAQKLPHCGFISIGAGLDFIAGSQKRAPWIIRKLTLEWVWRMLNNPRRLALRYGACIAILPGLAIQAMKARRMIKKTM